MAPAISPWERHRGKETTIVTEQGVRLTGPVLKADGRWVIALPRDYPTPGRRTYWRTLRDSDRAVDE